ARALRRCRAGRCRGARLDDRPRLCARKHPEPPPGAGQSRSAGVGGRWCCARSRGRRRAGGVRGKAAYLQSRPRHPAGDADRACRAHAGEGSWGRRMTAGAGTRIIRAVVALAIVAAVFAALVLWWPPKLYGWILAVHVMAFISWMAGMLYLPRLFVYHCGAEPGSKQSETFKVMERRLFTQIINPAMGVTRAAGLWMLWTVAWRV